MFSNERTDLREFYFECWEKHKNNQPLDALEQQILGAILLHPEYHPVFENFDKYIDKDYHADSGETNPFLHLGLHIGLQEQISTDRPAGIQAVYQALCKKLDPHEVEHQMMACLTEMIWQAHKHGSMPDEQEYLTQLKKLLD